MGDVATGPGWELRLGRWQDVLADVTECDAVITDPPYSPKTHGSQCHGRRDEKCGGEWVSARGIGYDSLSDDGLAEFAKHWHERASGWLSIQTDSELHPLWAARLRELGRYVFHPIPIVLKGMNVRLAGDGPSSWCVWKVAARPRSGEWLAERKRERDRSGLHNTLPGAYVGNPFDDGENTATAGRRGSVVGSKPLWLMRAIVRDYSEPGDLIVDPCAGGGTTLLAAAIEGRTAIGAECDPETFELAVKRLRKGYTPTFDWTGGDAA